MKFAKVALAAAAAILAAPASAMLVLQGTEPIGGTGLGAVSTLLTLQSPANTGDATGSVSFDGTTDVVSGNTTALNSTFTFASLGIESAAEIGIVFNASEPGNDAQVNLDGLSLTVFSTSGATLFTSGAVSCGDLNPDCSLTNTFQGTGNSGFLFTLDTVQQDALTAAVGQNTFGNLRLGLNATVSNATGGNETFFVTDVMAPIPEPETYALMMAGLGAIGFMARRRKQKQS